MEISIASDFLDKWPQIALGVVEANVTVSASPPALIEQLESLGKEKARELEISDISQLSPIKMGRKAYKAAGKDPARYRLASEALLRRIVKGKEMYFVNNVVEMNNYISIAWGFPICAFDKQKIRGDVSFTIGTATDVYEGIGRGVLNIEGLPAFADEVGKFGTPTSDSVRTQITDETSELMMIIVGFDGVSDELNEALSKLQQMLKMYGGAQHVESRIIHG
jgi:DNA/RNA-binding domain of Phe-tRNA-synthetase-like protein